MEPREYERMNEVEDGMWWYRGLHAMFAATYQRHSPPAGRLLVDVGCGTGGFLRELRSGPGPSMLLGVEPDARACLWARAKSQSAVVRGSVHDLPLADASADAVFSLDVLSHRMVNPHASLCEIHRCLCLGGLLFLNLPAYGWMRSAHDDRVHNVRRFTRRPAMELLRAAGFGIRAVTYWNTVLFPAMAARRILTRRRVGESDVRPFTPVVDRFCRRVLAVERRLIVGGISAPFGGSLLLVGVKQ
jgi:SAM-dependent methyltransferase